MNIESGQSLESELAPPQRSPEEIEQIKQEIADHRDYLFKFCLSRLRANPNARDLAQDIAQSTMMKAIKGLETWRQEAPLKQWLSSIAVNEIAQYFRRRAGEPRTHESLNDEESEEVWLPAKEGGEDELIERLDEPKLKGDLKEAIDKLPEKYKEVIQLRLEGLKYKDIAERLGLTEGLVKSRILRAKNELRKIIEAKEEN